jgi:hypothetical protein
MTGSSLRSALRNEIPLSAPLIIAQNSLRNERAMKKGSLRKLTSP